MRLIIAVDNSRAILYKAICKISTMTTRGDRGRAQLSFIKISLTTETHARSERKAKKVSTVSTK